MRGNDKEETPKRTKGHRGAFHLLSYPRRAARRLYDWMVSWSGRPSALPALFGFSVAESALCPVPPDPLLMAITLVKPRAWARTAAICAIGSFLGSLVGYFLGFAIMETIGGWIIDVYRARYYWERVIELYSGTWGVGFLAIAAFTPIPFNVATIAAGATHMPLLPFAVVSLAARAARFFLIARLLERHGAGGKSMVDRYFDWVSLGFVILLVLSFAAVRFVVS